MVSALEFSRLADKCEHYGAKVSLDVDTQQVTITNARGIGPYPMPMPIPIPILMAAARMRDYISRKGCESHSSPDYGADPVTGFDQVPYGC